MHQNLVCSGDKSEAVIVLVFCQPHECTQFVDIIVHSGVACDKITDKEKA